MIEKYTERGRLRPRPANYNKNVVVVCLENLQSTRNWRGHKSEIAPNQNA